MALRTKALQLGSVRMVMVVVVVAAEVAVAAGVAEVAEAGVGGPLGFSRTSNSKNTPLRTMAQLQMKAAVAHRHAPILQL